MSFIGKKFHKLTVIAPCSYKKYAWWCRCDCGSEFHKLINTGCLTRIKGGTTSCGCLHKENLIKRQKQFTTLMKKRTRRSKDLDKKYQHEYYINNREKISKQKSEYHKKRSLDKNINKINYIKRSLISKSDARLRVTKIVRNRVCKALKVQCKKLGIPYFLPMSATKALGCKRLEFIKHIESQFKDGMSWSNYGLVTWHLDHIIPLKTLNLTNLDDFKKACHYSNIRPLWAKDNYKRNRIYE